MSSPVFHAFQKLSERWARRVGMLAVVGVTAAGSLASLDAEAARLGGGRSFGRQSSIATQRSTTPPPAQPSPSQQPAPAPRAQPNAAPAQAPAAARSRWLGPIAGLAAGLGIAALLLHFGLGEAFAGAMANVIIIALLAAVGIWLIRKFTNRRRPVEPSYQTGSARVLPPSGGVRPDLMQEPRYTAPPTGQYLAPEANPLTTPQIGATPSVPADFGTEAFLRNAKVYFVRLQAAWDAGNIDDIREFTTPEMFAEIRLDLADRGAQPNQTDVVQLHADLLGIEERNNEYLASVRFNGLIRETVGAAAEPFSEVWNLSKSRLTGDGWLLAGIQQSGAH